MENSGVEQKTQISVYFWFGLLLPFSIINSTDKISNNNNNSQFRAVMDD